ncbi:MAG: hypothetical protein KGZ61_08865 [Sandarakinorhabdus sp.]|nr:hypothetical protein [Sandarakinorhabdus sp.]
MLIQSLKAGAVLTLTMAAFSVASAQGVTPGQAQNPASDATQATARVAQATNNQSSIFMLPSPAPGTWPILLTGAGMMGFAARRRTFSV